MARRYSRPYGPYCQSVGCPYRDPAMIPSLPHDDGVASGVFSSDGKRVATGTDDGKIAICDASTGKTVASMELLGSVWSVSFRPDRKIIAAAPDAGKARTWDDHRVNLWVPLLSITRLLTT
jgi:WD40 repeat protein